jgi:nicotinamide mononucleotide transporter
MNILDILGAAIGLVFVFSEYKASRWLWPSSLLMAAFYAVINFRIGWYANTGICIYNFLISIYGLLVWRGLVERRQKMERRHPAGKDNAEPLGDAGKMPALHDDAGKMPAVQEKPAVQEERPVTSCPARLWPWLLLATAALTLLFRWLLPLLGEATMPLLDALSAALGIVGMWMLSQKYWEQWLFWLVSEPILAYIYFATGYTASAVMYVIYEVFVIMGIIRWKKLSIS